MPVATEVEEVEIKKAKITAGKRAVGQKIWIDLDNSPHVPFFRPIIEELEKRGHEVLITARDAYQVRELLAYYGVTPGKMIGGHHGRVKIFKALGTLTRGLELAAFVRKEKPALSVAHGSRGCLVGSGLLGIPHVMLTDYEFVAKIPVMKPAFIMVPSVVPDTNLSVQGARVLKYPGIKEDVYLSRFRPDQTLRERMGIPADALMVMVRPPATEAHYHNPEAEGLLTEALNIFLKIADARVILLPRNKRQEADLRAAWGEGLGSGKLMIPEKVEDGMNLIWNSDLVISGGGTMNREAAAMGVPVYSIFRGQIGAVDQYLEREGRLVMVRSKEEVHSKIKTVKRMKSVQRSGRDVPAMETIVDNICSILDGQKN
jgi:uncharacterized protein